MVVLCAVVCAAKAGLVPAHGHLAYAGHGYAGHGLAGYAAVAAPAVIAAPHHGHDIDYYVSYLL